MPRFSPGQLWRDCRAVFGRFRRRSSPDAEAARRDRELVFGLSQSRIPTSKQLNYVGQVLQPRERVWVQWLGFLAVLTALILFVSYLNRHIELQPRRGGVLTEGMIGVPQFINPALARISTVDDELTTLNFRGLMKMNEDFQLVPDLAKSIDVSPDGKVYTVKLQPHLKWSDGQPLTSRDAVYTFKTMADPLYQSPQLSIFQNVKVEAPDSQTIVFTLNEPLAPFLSYLIVGLLPEHLWVDATPQSFPLAELNLKPVGNGPFQFQSLAKDRDGNVKSMQFVRNSDYHGRAPYLNKVEVKFYPDYTSALQALSTGAIDSLGGIRYEDIAKVSSNHKINDFAVSQLTAVFINQKTNGALKAKETRIALSYATNRAAIVDDVLMGHANPIVGPILPGYLGYNPGLKRYDYDLDKANQILEDAGWKKTESGIRQKGEQQLTFVFTVVNQPNQVAVAEQLKSDWEKIGANVEIKKVEPSAIQRDILRPRQYEALLFGQIFTTDPDPYPFWHSSQQKENGFNLSIFFSSKIDQDLEHGRRTTSNEERAVDYFDFQNVLAEEVPAIFLFENHYLYAHPKSLRGFDADRIVSGAQRFQNISTWYTNTWPRWVAKKSNDR